MKNKKKILYVQYTNPAYYPSLEHSSHFLVQEGWKVLFLGVEVSGNDGVCFKPNPNISVYLLRSCPAGPRQKLHFLLFCFWVLRWFLWLRPAWIYASDVYSCPITLFLSCFARSRIIYHEHDSPSLTFRNPYFTQFVLSTRKRLARKVEICVLPNIQRVERFKNEISGCPNVIPVMNCPVRGELSSSREQKFGRELLVLYHGSIVPSRLPQAILFALHKLSGSVKLKVIGYETQGHVGYVRQLKELANRLGIDRLIEFVGVLRSRDELLRHGQDCDVGIVFLPEVSNDINEQMMAGASNKPFEYLACGLALLVSNLSDWRKMYVDPGYGFACDPEDPEDIVENLSWFLEHPKEMREMGERGRKRIVSEWNYEQQFSPILKILEGK